MPGAGKKTLVVVGIALLVLIIFIIIAITKDDEETDDEKTVDNTVDNTHTSEYAENAIDDIASTFEKKLATSQKKHADYQKKSADAEKKSAAYRKKLVFDKKIKIIVDHIIKTVVTPTDTPSIIMAKRKIIEKKIREQAKKTPIDIIVDKIKKAVVAIKPKWRSVNKQKGCSNAAPQGKNTWEYVDGDGRLVGGSYIYRDTKGGVSLNTLRAACEAVPGNRCKAVSQYKQKNFGGLIWYRNCDETAPDWNVWDGNTNSVDYK